MNNFNKLAYVDFFQRTISVLTLLLIVSKQNSPKTYTKTKPDPYENNNIYKIVPSMKNFVRSMHTNENIELLKVNTHAISVKLFSVGVGFACLYNLTIIFSAIFFSKYVFS